MWRANRMLRYRRKLESHLAHAHITRVRVRDAAEFAAKLAAAAGEAKTRGALSSGSTSGVGAGEGRDGMSARDWAVKQPTRVCYGRLQNAV